MGSIPSADVFFGYHLIAGSFGELYEFADDDLVVEPCGFEFDERMVYIPGTNTDADWDGPVKLVTKHPSNEAILKFQAAIAREEIPVPVDIEPDWVLCVSYA